MKHKESHLIRRIGWLRAAVLGANDGIISTSSLIIGMAAASANKEQMIMAGVAGFFGGAMSMAAGEYVSVSSQSDTEQADLAREAKELQDNHEFEVNELAAIYEEKGVDKETARKVAIQLMEKDALAIHAQEELGISDLSKAKPVQAAFASAATFSIGAILPLLALILAPDEYSGQAVAASAVIFLAVLGYAGARTGKASAGKAVLRVTFWGILAMIITALAGRLFGAVV